MTGIKYSVAMATYNGEKYIEEQLDSIRQQTVEVDEVIICDDRSTDNTAGIISSYIEKYGLGKKWQLFINAENKGYAGNFIGAVRETHGEFVFFADQDDVWVENRIEKMGEALDDDQNILLLGSEFTPFSVTDDAPSVPAWELKKFKGDGSVEKLTFDAANIFIGAQGCTMGMRKSFLRKIDTYWYPGWAHDEYVWKLALCLDGLYFLHMPTLNRRLHSNNVTLHKEHENSKRVKYLEELLNSHQVTLRFAIDNDLSKDRIKLLKKNIKATKLRLKVVKEGKWFYTFILLFGYGNCYHKMRAIPVELMMSLRARKK